MDIKQKTIKQTTAVRGIGIHSGLMANMKLIPAPPNTGIVFVRMGTAIPANRQNAVKGNLNTELVVDGVKVKTVEHLLSAISGLGIDNLYIELDAEEVPILDGSAAAYCYLLKEAGIEEQNAYKKSIKITKPVRVGDDRGWAEFLPHDKFTLDFAIEFDHPAIGNSEFKLDLTPQSYLKQISRARTFGFMKDIDALYAANLALGASTDNSIVLGDHNVINAEGLRYDDEFVRHKLLDAIGDLYLSGHHYLGYYRAYKSGHWLNYQLVEKVFETNAYVIVDHTPEKTPEQNPLSIKNLQNIF